MTQLQDKPVIVGNPVEIDRAANMIRQLLSNLDWISHPYHIAQSFFRKTEKGNFYYPETYAGGDGVKFKYHRLTPDNDYSGMFFFIIGDEKNDYANNQNNYLTYDVSIIFSANLKLINESKLNQGLFTQELIRDVRRMLTKNALQFDFQYKINRVTRNLRDVYREFVLDDIEQYNRAPMQCFRFDMSLTFQEECYDDNTTIIPDYTDVGLSINVIDIANNNLPIEVPGGTGFLIVNAYDMNSELNVENFKPVGLLKGATVRVRKMDDTDHKITYTVGDLEYSFVNCKTEYIDLLWDGSRLII